MSLPPATERLMEAARRLGLEISVSEFPEGTKTAQDAAAAIGCPVSAIVKSLVFVVRGSSRDPSEEPVLALVPGDRRLDPAKLAAVAGGSEADRAPLERVREATGYAAGGTPPFGHATPLRVFSDPTLRRNDPVWAAGGTPTTVFPITLEDLDRTVAPVWAEIT